MPRHCTRLVTFALALLPVVASAEGFVFTLTSPDIRIEIPGLPSFSLDVHPLNAKQPDRRFLGNYHGPEGAFGITISTPTAAADLTAWDCAASIAEDRWKSAQRRWEENQGSEQPPVVKLDENTYSFSYVEPLSPTTVALRTHILGKAGSTHCIDVFIQKGTKSKNEDLDKWLAIGSGAKLIPASNQALHATPDGARERQR